MANVVPMRRKPRNFTSAEAFYDEVRERIHMCGMTYGQIADKTGVSKSTINNIAMGNTTWPRHTTLFPLLRALNMRLTLEKPNGDTAQEEAAS